MATPAKSTASLQVEHSATGARTDLIYPSRKNNVKISSRNKYDVPKHVKWHFG
jgi:hypothetical protein